MKIRAIEVRRDDVDLVRPYRIAYHATSAAAIFYVRLRAESGEEGYGAGTPVAAITGETVPGCADALSEAQLGWLEGRDARQLGKLCREARERMERTPAARAAVDMALHDLFARKLALPLVELLGRAHLELPTSVTIGIKGAEETLNEAREHVERGFDHLKVKLGLAFEEDHERLVRLRESLGRDVRVRVDANQGYSVEEAPKLARLADELDLELIEQPLPAAEIAPLQRLPRELRAKLAADESLHTEQDALRLSQPPQPFGIFNIKLMKCGGVSSAQRIAATAETAGVQLMWGCMDESLIGIAAALHAAYASPATRYLDLDGSLDLVRDLGQGGFVLDRGKLRTAEAPGLGVTFRD